MEARVIRGGNVEVAETEWGSLQWLVGGGGGGDAGIRMTFGRVTFKPGQANPAHRHPNCDELLFVVAGAIEHSLPEGGTTILRAGDGIILPRGQKHQARNAGSGEAVVVVAYNSAKRETLEE